MFENAFFCKNFADRSKIFEFSAEYYIIDPNSSLTEITKKTHIEKFMPNDGAKLLILAFTDSDIKSSDSRFCFFFFK